MRYLLAAFFFLFFPVTWLLAVHNPEYPWKKDYSEIHNVNRRIEPPFPYIRTEVEKKSLGEWLRHFPLHDYNREVKLYSGRPKKPAGLSRAVLDIDCGNRDIQRSIALPIRLWAEYMWVRGEYWGIEFITSSSERIDFNLWASGLRTYQVFDRIRFRDCGIKNYSYENFKDYLNMFFPFWRKGLMKREFTKLSSSDEPRIGDFIWSGSSDGHGLIIMDRAMHRSSCEKIYLLAEGGSPAQEFHIVRNLKDRDLDPWYSLSPELYTPQCILDGTEIYRPFPEKKPVITEYDDGEKDLSRQAVKFLLDNAGAADFIVNSLLFPAEQVDGP